MSNRAIILKSLVAAAFIATTPIGAAAQPRGPSCQQLWHQRNSIYAQNGQCFQTQRAINAFGRGCFPPYGRLSRAEQRQVARIQAMEARRGCRG